MGRQNEMETFDNDKLDTDWQDNVNIYAQYTEMRQGILDRLSEFREMRDGSLCRISVARHIIEWTAQTNALSIPLRTAMDGKHPSFRRFELSKRSARKV